MEKYYSEFTGRMLLRDLLATDRTQLANERTLLAYLRTALTLFIAGASFIQFFSNLLIEVIGWAFLPVSIFFGILGFQRFYKMKALLDKLKNREISLRDNPEYDI